MGDLIDYLVSIVHRGELSKVAVRVKYSLISEDCANYPMEPASREELRKLLPEHVRSMGPIVDVEPIFDICIIEGTSND